MFRIIALALTVSAALLLSACAATAPSSATSAATPGPPSPGPVGSAEPAPSSPDRTMVGGDPGTWSPLQLGPEADGTTIDLVVGQAARLNLTNAGIQLYSSDPDVVAVSQPSTEGTYQAVGGLVARGVGEADVQVSAGEEIVLEFRVRVTARGQ